MSKVPFWNRFSSWQEAESFWDQGKKEAESKNPLKILKTYPNVPGIQEDTRRHLKWKSLKWMVAEDEGLAVTKYILKKPFTHGFRYLKSLFKKKSYIRDD